MKSSPNFTFTYKLAIRPFYEIPMYIHPSPLCIYVLYTNEPCTKSNSTLYTIHMSEIRIRSHVTYSGVLCKTRSVNHSQVGNANVIGIGYIHLPSENCFVFVVIDLFGNSSTGGRHASLYHHRRSNFICTRHVKKSHKSHDSKVVGNNISSEGEIYDVPWTHAHSMERNFSVS